MTRLPRPRWPTAAELDRVWSSWPAMLVLAGALLFVLGKPLLDHPLWTAPSRDPAWYTWRANVILGSSPGRLAVPWGPPGVFAGGYRVATPLAGALLERIAGVDAFSFTALLFVGIPVLTGLFLGAAAHRAGRPGVAVPIALLTSVGLFLTTPFIGYLDDTVAVMLLTLALAFAPRAQRSTPARIALVAIAALTMLAHPTTCALFAASLLAMAMWHVVTSRFALRDVVRRDGPLLASVGAGFLVGAAMWLGVWGPSASFRSAANAPPYAEGAFLDRLQIWLESLHLPIVVPLIVVAIVSTVLTARRSRRPAGTFELLSLWWLAPVAGTFAFAVGGSAGASIVIPYYRFLNGTGGIISASALGASAAVTWLLRRRGRPRVAATALALVVVGALAWMIADGLSVENGEHWASADVRVALAAVHRLAVAAGDRPIVLVMDHGRNNGSEANRAYGWAKSATNAFRIGLPGDADARSATFVGTVEDAVAGRASTGRTSTYDAVARRFFDDVRARLAEIPRAPLALVWTEYYRGSVRAAGDEVTPTLFVVEGAGLYAPAHDAVASARAAAAFERSRIEASRTASVDAAHLLRVACGLALLLVVPGLLAAPFFGLDDATSRVGLVPGVSIVLTLLSGVAVLAVRRGPLTTWTAVVVIAVACALGAVCRFVARRRRRRTVRGRGRHERRTDVRMPARA